MADVGRNSLWLLLTLSLAPGATLRADLFQAVRNNDLSAVEAEAARSVDARGAEGATALMEAAAFGSAEAVRLLIEAGADVNAANGLGATALIWALGDLEKSRLLVEAGADVNARTRSGRTPLLVAAARNGASATVRLLLEHGADPAAADDKGGTPLLEASLIGDFDTVKLLLDRGVDPNQADKSGGTALQNAAANDNLAMVRLLLAKGARVNDANWFSGAVRHGDLALKGLTPLMLAAPEADAAVLETLLEAGADVNARDSRGMTPLMLAVASEKRHPRAVELLLSHGAEVNVVSEASETALDWALKFGDPAVIAALERAGAERRSEPQDAPTPEGEPRNARAAAELALGLVQRSVSEFFRQSGCISCHHQNLAQIAASEARQASLEFDQQAAAESVEATAAQWSFFAPALLERSDAPGSPDTPIYSLFSLAVEKHPADAATDALFANIAAQQRQDGSWRLMGFSRAPLEESYFARTAMAVRALETYAPAGRRSELRGQVERARSWLVESKPRTTDDHVWRLLGLVWTDAPASAAREAADQLLALQRTDGGWSQNPYLSSDAHATGNALWALRTAGVLAAQDSVYRNGVDFLLRTQLPDGSWRVESRSPKFQPYFESGFPHGHDQWISIAATSWAVAALAPAGRDGGLTD